MPPSTTISGISGTASGKSKLLLYDEGGADGNKNGLDVGSVAAKFTISQKFRKS